MYKEDFVLKLSSKFKAKNDDNRNDGFRDDLELFSSICPENYLQDVYNWISLTHKYSAPFLLSKIYDYAKDQGYINKAKVNKTPTWNTCLKCGCHYSVAGRCCPKCRHIKASISTGETYPDSYINVSEDCYYCTIFPEIKKNPKWMTFKDCGMYGVKQDPTCKPCQCSECCDQMRMYNQDQRGTIEKYRTGELSQPWLFEVDPLNETAKQMLKHMRKSGFQEFKKELD